MDDMLGNMLGRWNQRTLARLLESCRLEGDTELVEILSARLAAVPASGAEDDRALPASGPALPAS